MQEDKLQDVRDQGDGQDDVAYLPGAKVTLNRAGKGLKHHQVKQDVDDAKVQEDGREHAPYLKISRHLIPVVPRQRP